MERGVALHSGPTGGLLTDGPVPGVPVTELLYQADSDAAYVRSFRARVVALPPGAVVLDRTFFYAVGGGQPADRGRLVGPQGQSVPVADVGRSGGYVLHRVGKNRDPSAAPLRVGDEVTGEIDWGRRYEHMRLHTGQHLASALLFARLGLRTQQAMLGRGAATIDLEAPIPANRSFPEFENSFREAVRANRPVRVRHLPRAEYEAAPAPRSGLIPIPSGIDRVRLIEIEGYDASPCGGTHLRDTGAIGGVRFEPPGPAAPARTRFTLEPSDAPTTPVG
jgi:Ser-tRNA(Ala) deacylase AlaX